MMNGYFVLTTAIIATLATDNFVLAASDLVSPATFVTDFVQCTDKDPNIAIRACTALQEMDSKNVVNALAYYNKGNAELTKNMIDAAFSDFSKAIDIAPEFDFALHNRAKIYDLRGEYQFAISDFTRAITISPIGGHYYNRALTYMHMGSYVLAAQDYATTESLWPTQNGPYAGRCRALAAQGDDLQSARAECEHALTKDPTNSMFLTLRAFVKLKQKDFEGALVDSDTALKNSSQQWTEGPEFKSREIQPADALLMRGIAETEIGRTDAGKRDIDAATEQKHDILAQYARMGVNPNI
jgi:tetratricopeptide (TPR) repeat protein